MKMAFVSLMALFVISGCSSSPSKQIAVPVPGGGHHIMAARAIEPSFKAAAIIGTRTFVWRFHLPQGTTVSNWWWDLQRSTNLVAWTTIQTNVMAPVDVLATNEMEFFRLGGRL